MSSVSALVPRVIPFAPQLRPTPARTPSLASMPQLDTPRVVSHRLRSVRLQQVKHRAITLADVQPGDLAFTYKPHHKTWLQHLIAFGERIVNILDPDFKGSKDVCHAFLILESLPQKKRLRVADAAAGENKVGVDVLEMNFKTAAKADDPDASYLIYRFTDPRMQKRITELARNWTSFGVDNFSNWQALIAPVHPRRISRKTRARLEHLTEHLFAQKPVPSMRGAGYYKVMCSEFIANLGAVASMSLYCEDHPKARPSQVSLHGLRRGPGGNIFNCDPRGMVPSALQGRLARDPMAHVVGYLPTWQELSDITPANSR